MLNLLNANFRRLWKSRFLWIALAIMCAVTLFNVFGNLHYNTMLYGDTVNRVSANTTLFPGEWLGVILVAIFSCLFIGREHSDKTIRNKIIVGHSRTTVYLANLIVCSVAALILYLIPMLLVGFALGIPLLGGFTLSVKAVLILLLCKAMALIAFSALFVWLAMSMTSKTGVAILALLLIFLTMGGTPLLGEMLEAPEYVEELGYVDEDGNYVESDAMMKNPAYLSGAKRIVLEFLYDFVPSGSIEQTSTNTLTKDLYPLPIYSLLFASMTTVAGLLIFRRKNLV